MVGPNVAVVESKGPVAKTGVEVTVDYTGRLADDFRTREAAEQCCRLNRQARSTRSLRASGGLALRGRQRHQGIVQVDSRGRVRNLRADWDRRRLGRRHGEIRHGPQGSLSQDTKVSVQSRQSEHRSRNTAVFQLL